MTALTMTLLPEPVAPAISRCGIFARSTALAAPATSRPRANVSFDSAAVNSTSSRIRRRATMLKSLFGISIPTALLPGIGASIRSERAARAIARSSASASIRETRTSTAGWISYWVTTGPALRLSIWAEIPKLASFLMMISSFRAWAAGLPPGSVGLAMSSRSASGGRTYSIRSFVGGESPGVGDVVERADRTRRVCDERRRGGGRRSEQGRTSRTSGRSWAPRPGSGHLRRRRRPSTRARSDRATRGRPRSGRGRPVRRRRAHRCRAGSSPGRWIAPHRGSRGRAEPAGHGRGRVEEVARTDVEADHQANCDQGQQDDDRAGSREQRR